MSRPTVLELFSEQTTSANSTAYIASYSEYTVIVRGTPASGIIKIQISDNGTNFVDVANSTLTDAQGAYNISIGKGVYVRANLSGATGSTSLTVTLYPLFRANL